MSIYDVLGVLGVTVGLSMMFVMGWLFMITITAGVEIYRNRSHPLPEIIKAVRKAIQPLLDEL